MDRSEVSELKADGILSYCALIGFSLMRKSMAVRSRRIVDLWIFSLRIPHPILDDICRPEQPVTLNFGERNSHPRVRIQITAFADRVRNTPVAASLNRDGDAILV
jgi:hypothetical protein